MNQRVWSTGAMTLTGEDWGARTETCPNTTSFTINPTGLAWDRSWASSVRGRRLAAWAMALQKNYRNPVSAGCPNAFRYWTHWRLSAGIMFLHIPFRMEIRATVQLIPHRKHIVSVKHNNHLKLFVKIVAFFLRLARNTYIQCVGKTHCFMLKHGMYIVTSLL